MWHDMFIEQIPFAEKIVRTVVVYAAIAVVFRLTGKRGLAGTNTFDFAVLFLLSNVVQNAIIGSDNSLVGGLVGAVTLVSVNAAMNRLIAGSARAERLFEGRPTAVVADGRVVEGALRRLGMRRSELEHAIRLQNGDNVSQIETASLEASGQLLLSLKPSAQNITKSDLAELTRRLDRIDDLLQKR